MSYVYLAVAIICELFGTTCMKYSDGFSKLWPSLFTLLFYGVMADVVKYMAAAGDQYYSAAYKTTADAEETAQT